MSVVVVHNAFKSYEKKENFKVLCGLTMNVPQSTIFGIIGSSSCGKTTLLSCILGMQHLDNGQIKIFGYENQPNKSLKKNRCIGYMPQEMALIGELTVKETIYYFGNIFEMNSKKLTDRYKMLQDLLELPPDNQLIIQCSGGEQRRVSFAAAIIHEPDLLILDEPTVGLDALLREKIWNFLKNATKTTKLSVILTTHYIDEAQNADIVGLMKNGRLMTQDTPKNIITRTGGDTFGNAVLKFHQKSTFDSETQFESSEIVDFETKEENHSVKKLFRWQIISAVINKLTAKVMRNYGTVSIFTLFPFFMTILLNFVIGGDPTNLNIALINNDVLNCKISQNYHGKMINDYCEIEDFSCRFINEINENHFKKFSYKTKDEAMKDAKKLKLAAILNFDKNFTQATNALFNLTEDDNEIDPKFLDSSQIKIRLDCSDLRISLFMKLQMYSTYLNISQKVMEECGLPKKLQSLPVAIEKMYDVGLKPLITPAFTVLIIFFTASELSGMFTIEDRNEGSWNRSILAGVRVTEIQVALTIITMVFMTFSLVSSIAAFSLTDIQYKGSILLLIVFYLLFSLCGTLSGLCLGSVCQSFHTLSSVLVCFHIAVNFLGGYIWPVEGFHFLIRWIADVNPFTVVICSVCNIIIKGFGLSHPTVFKGFSVLIAWNLALLIINFIISGKKKFSRNT